MTFKNQITAVLLLVCILLTPALASSASAHAYDHVYTDVTVITPDSLDDVFGETEVERAAYTYEMVELNNSRAIVALEMELKIGHDYYTTVVSGTVNAYTLPSGDTLYEGPIDGSMTVGEDEYRVTVGFTKVESTDDVMISATIQGDSTMVVISFGDNVIQGEVLDLFIERTEGEQQNYLSGSNMIENVSSGEFGNGEEGTVAPAMIGDGFAPIIHPGDGTGSPYPNLGPNGEWEFQSIHIKKHDNDSYKAMETRVYFDTTSNNLIVMIHPYISETQEYVESRYGTTAGSMLYTMEIELEMLQSTGTSYAEIDGYSIPNTDRYTTNILDFESVYLAAFVKEYWRTHLSVSGNVFTALETAIHGRISIEADEILHKAIHIDLSFLDALVSYDLENVLPGLPIIFDLERDATTTYTGGTRYKVTTEVRYCIILEPFEGAEQTVLPPIFIVKNLEFEAEIDLP